MPEQLTIRLPDDLSRLLNETALRLRRKRSEVVRMALERYLHVGRPEPAGRRVESLLGSLESGVSDLADHHREYVLESLRRGR